MAARRADRLYEWLNQLPAPDAELILGAGLERAEPAYFERIVESLFTRNTEAAWAGLIAIYPRLTPAMRVRLNSNPQQMRSGLVRVLRGGSPPGRCNALHALNDYAAPELAYLLPDALRASSGDVRRAASVTLRRLAEVAIARDAGDDAGPAPGARPARFEPRDLGKNSARVAVAQAALEALRGFDMHYRLEVVEVALWFCAEIGGALWEMLGNRRSPTGHVVSVNLRAWDGPRMARFLLEALTQSTWRALARDILTSWGGPARLAAILQNSDLLARADFREALSSLKRPAWFAGLNDLSEVPAALRPQAPEWLVLLGYRPEEKRALLAQWSETAFLGLKEAAEKAARHIPDSQVELDVRSLPGASRRPGDSQSPAGLTPTRETAACAVSREPSAHADDPESRSAALKVQAQLTLQRLASRGPDRTTLDEIAALEQALAQLRAELAPGAGDDCGAEAPR